MVPSASHYIKVGSEEFHYLQTGGGKKLLIGFPGYGHDASSLEVLTPFLAQAYTCVLVDMPHHGKSRWNKETVFTKHMLKELATVLMEKYKVNKVSLLGYSMGGRVCLSIIELIPGVVERATLVASDGLVGNKYYYFVTRTAIGRRMFSSMLTRPAPYQKLFLWLKNNRWITEWQHKFVSYYTSDEAQRKKLLHIWPAMSALIPSAKKTRMAIRKHSIQVTLFMGKFDKVIPAVSGERFARNMDSVSVHILDKGHQVIGPDTAQQIAQTLL